MSDSRRHPRFPFAASRRSAALIALTMLVGAGYPVCADGPEPDETLGEIIDRLGSQSYVERQTASARLREFVDRNLNVLESHLVDPTLSAEQRYRVLDVISDKLINQPRGALGVSMNTRMLAMGQPVEIVSLIAGMPAERVLKVGDRIRRLDATPIRSGDDLRWFVQSKMPGDVVLITVDRPRIDKNGLRVFDDDNEMLYESLQLEMELGSADQLDRIGGSGSGTAVLEQRLKQAQDANDRFAPQSREIVILNREDLHSAAVGSNAGNNPVDNHPIIMRLLEDLNRVHIQGQRVTTQDEERWEGWQKQLTREFTDPKRTAAERELLYKIIKRFIELRPQ